jgi:cell fate regulator YaaT (PSP1 superfamily)
MAGSITPLDVMLEDAELRAEFDKLEPPKSMVVRHGRTKQIAELPYDGKDTPGCGSKLVIRTDRGMELAEMLTTACGNSGCSVSVSRKDMLKYIEQSGGKKFPFSTKGRVLRVATVEDVMEQQRQDNRAPDIKKLAKQMIAEMELAMKLVDIEMLLGGERVIFHYTAEDWVDFRDLVKRLASEYQTRIEMHQVNAREEARLVADYERCGQQCCCKQFLKVLKPVSMRSAKIQKATLDPTKISGRCGRLMCCLRYEDATYDMLRKKLPHKQTAALSEDGIGTVINSQILTQLVLLRLDETDQMNAYPLEELTLLSKEEAAEKRAEREAERERVRSEYQARMSRPRPRPPRQPQKPRQSEQDRKSGQSGQGGQSSQTEGQGDQKSESGRPPKSKSRSRGRGRGNDGSDSRPQSEQQGDGQQGQGNQQGQQGQGSQGGEGGGKKKRKRGRRRRRGGKGRPEGGDGSGSGGSGDSGDSGGNRDGGNSGSGGNSGGSGGNSGGGSGGDNSGGASGGGDSSQ